MTCNPASSNSGFHILTFGCQMNQRDSGWLSAALSAKGFHQAQLADADFVLINTCSVREKPQNKLHTAIRRIRQTAPKAKIAILGCVAQQLGAALHDLDDAVALVAGTDAVGDIPDALLAIQQNPGAKRALLAMSPHYRERPAADEPVSAGQALVTIMQGCNNYCSYCIVPYTRGPQKSRAREAILAECRAALAKGAVELVLLGQNVNAWRDGDTRFADLLTAVANLDGLQRLRFITPHPRDMDDAAIERIAALPKVCPSLHLPLQAGSDRILAAMRRRHTQADYLRLVAKLKAARPELAFTTDLIVGFPGETEADFQETLALVAECGFMSSFSFCYSDRPGTRSALMPDKIAPEIKLARLATLQALQERLTGDWLAQRQGQITEILLEKPSPRGPSGFWQGRDPYGVAVHVAIDCDMAGELAHARITEAKKHSLLGEIIPS